MKKYEQIIDKATKIADIGAGIGIFTIMALMVMNILLKNLFKSAIVGTYEYVSLLTAITVSLALARCAFLDFHISVGLFVDKAKAKTQHVLGFVTQSITVVIMAAFSYHVFAYAMRTHASGRVTISTQIPLSIFIHITGLGLALLTLVVLLRAIQSLKKAVIK